MNALVTIVIQLVICRQCCWTVHCISPHLPWWYHHLQMYCWWRQYWNDHLESGWELPQQVCSISWKDCFLYLWAWQSFCGCTWDWVWNKCYFILISTELHCSSCIRWHTDWVPWAGQWWSPRGWSWRKYHPCFRSV